jgi:hypothetical protein
MVKINSKIDRTDVVHYSYIVYFDENKSIATIESWNISDGSCTLSSFLKNQASKWRGFGQVGVAWFYGDLESTLYSLDMWTNIWVYIFI